MPPWRPTDIDFGSSEQIELTLQETLATHYRRIAKLFAAGNLKEPFTDARDAEPGCEVEPGPRLVAPRVLFPLSRQTRASLDLVEGTSFYALRSVGSPCRFGDVGDESDRRPQLRWPASNVAAVTSTSSSNGMG